MINFQLSGLFKEMGRAEFLENYLKNTPIFLESIDQYKDLIKRPFLSSLDELFDMWPAEVNAYLKGTQDEVNSGLFSKEEAKKLFNEEKAGLFFDDPNRFDETLNSCLMQIKEDLGLSQMTYARSLLYLIPAGGGTATHFDQNINFIIQISGNKKWWLLPNENVVNPLVRHTIGHESDPELASYAHAPFPESLDMANAQELTLKPGSLLFLPRGVWHKTYAEEDSLSLNFTFSSPSWADLFLGALRSRLVQSEDWRELANFVNEPNFKEHSISFFNQLLMELSEDSKHWRAEDILKATEE